MCDEAKVFDNVIVWVASHDFTAVRVFTKQHEYSIWDILASDNNATWHTLIQIRDYFMLLTAGFSLYTEGFLCLKKHHGLWLRKWGF